MIDQNLLATGWHLCPMDRGSKNPGSILGKDWPSKCSSDPAVIASWPDGCNIGVLLGSKSGIIDLEFDSDHGELLVENWMEECGHPQTPTYRSAKSVHRLFQWEEKFALEGAKFGMMGVEFRFGCDAAQSVIPPSVHESGAQYEWIISPWECSPVPLPELIYKMFLNMKQTSEKKTAKAVTVDPRYLSGDSLLTKARNFIEQTHSWESILSSDGWKFVRNRGDASDWHRPGKSKGSISGTVNFGGSKTLRVFSTSCEPLKPESSYDKFAYLCCTRFSDDPVKAAFGLCPEDVLGRKKQVTVDISALIEDEEDAPDTDEFMEAMIPQAGLLREIYEFYRTVSQFPSPIMGLATALSFCQTIFGRRIRSQTDLRTNDYNVVMAPTGSGKESCETTMLKLFQATGYDLTHPPDVQSGNGLLATVNAKPCGIWVCDEFGKTLESLVDKRANQHLKQIGTHLLKMYGKSSTAYGGAAHSAGAKNRTEQPHLCLLGLTTPKVFTSITADQVDDGLFGRLAFFVVQNRPEMVISPTEPPNQVMIEKIKQWIEWQPKGFGNLNENPAPETIRMSDEAFSRWSDHSAMIRQRMDSEGELRAGVWCRTAARTMKLAMTYRAARLAQNPSMTDWNFIQIEKQDIEWAVKLSNFLSRCACNLLLDDVVDVQRNMAAKKILDCLEKLDQVQHRDLTRRFQKITAAEFQAAANQLEKSGLITIESEIPKTGGRKKLVYRKSKNTSDN
jgi:hypothetical protein